MWTSIAQFKEVKHSNFGKYMKKLKFLCNVENANLYNHFGKLFLTIFVTVKYAKYFFIFWCYMWKYMPTCWMPKVKISNNAKISFIERKIWFLPADTHELYIHTLKYRATVTRLSYCYIQQIWMNINIIFLRRYNTCPNPKVHIYDTLYIKFKNRQNIYGHWSRITNYICEIEP